MSPFPRYGTSATPFGGLGSLSDPFGLARPPVPPTSTPSSSASAWPLKSESSLLSSQEKQRREAEAAAAAEREREQQARKAREAAERERERKARERERRERERREREFRERNGSGGVTPDALAKRRDSSRSPARTPSGSLLHGMPGLGPSSASASSSVESLVKREEAHLNALFAHLPPHLR